MDLKSFLTWSELYVAIGAAIVHQAVVAGLVPGQSEASINGYMQAAIVYVLARLTSKGAKAIGAKVASAQPKQGG